MNTNLIFIKENIPVNLNFSLRFKETIHNFFRRPTVVKIFTFFPSFLLGKHKELAKLITKCHQTFTESSPYLAQMQVTVYGGDKLETLLKLEKKQEKPKNFKPFSTVFKFSTNTSLEEAKIMRQELGGQKNERIAILNLANRWQPGGVGLTPYGGSQEEDLVRHSNLAWGLDSRFKSEVVHGQLHQIREQEGLHGNFNHHIPCFGAVISKNVTFLDHEKKEQFDILSAAAPDMRKGSDEYAYIQAFGENAKEAHHQFLKNKIKAVFDAAISENMENLVLGAFGCGCFQNDPTEVAEIFAEVLSLDSYKGRFHRITFAITEDNKLNIFRDKLKNVVT